jgi:hypothetical protein
MQQHKINSKEKLLVKRYTTTEDGGQSYDMLFTGININRKWKSDQQWFTDYGTRFANLH